MLTQSVRHAGVSVEGMILGQLAVQHVTAAAVAKEKARLQRELQQGKTVASNEDIALAMELDLLRSKCGRPEGFNPFS